jgi:hypothetical protein
LAGWLAPDIYWNIDHGQLLGMAESANAAGTWVTYGLRGTHTAEYGPVPANLQQIALALGGDLFTAARLYNVIYFATLAVGVWMLTRLLALPLGYGLLLLATPVLWTLGRSMWDNTVLFPTTLLALACYGRFLLTGGRGWLAGAILFCGLVALTHFMGLPLAGAIGVHAVVRRGRALLKAWVPVAATVLLLGVYATPYLVREKNRLTERLNHSPEGEAAPAPAAALDEVQALTWISAVPTAYDVPPAYPARMSRPQAAGFALLGGRLFSGAAQFFTEPVHAAWLQTAARIAGGISWVSVPLSWIGLIVLARRASWRWRVNPGSDAPAAAESVTRELGAVIVVAVLLLAGLLAVMRTCPFLHYYHGVMVPYFVAVAAGASALRGAGAWVVGGLVVCLAILSVQQVVTTLEHPTEIMTLRALDAAARPMAGHAADVLDTSSQKLALAPHALTAIVGYYQHRATTPPRPTPVANVTASGAAFAFSNGELPAGSAYRIRLDRTRRYHAGQQVVELEHLPAAGAVSHTRSLP